MKKDISTAILFFFILIFSIVSYAQVDLSLSLSRKSYIQYENIICKITLKNNTAHPLVFGNNTNLKGAIYFVIKNTAGKTWSTKEEKINPFNSDIIEPGETSLSTVSISSLLSLNDPNAYSIYAVFEYPQLKEQYRSNSVSFSIEKGSTVWQAEVGIPSFNDKKDIIEGRQYVLKTVYDGKNKLFILLIESTSHVYGVARLGYDIGIKKPECLIDRLSKLHILIQTSPSIFSYFIYNPDCSLEKKEVYKKSETSSPTLIKDEKTGNIIVVGGLKAENGKDYIEDRN